MQVTIQIKTEYGITAHTKDVDGQRRDIPIEGDLVTVMKDCQYGEKPDDEWAERIYRAARHFNEAVGADFKVIVTVRNDDDE